MTAKTIEKLTNLLEGFEYKLIEQDKNIVVFKYRNTRTLTIKYDKLEKYSTTIAAPDGSNYTVKDHTTKSLFESIEFLANK